MVHPLTARDLNGVMIRHIAMFCWTADATEEQCQELSDRLAALPDLVPSIVGYTFGPDLELNEGNFDYAVVADFTDVDGYVTYRDHAAHQAVIAECIAPIRASRSAVQFEFGS